MKRFKLLLLIMLVTLLAKYPVSFALGKEPAAEKSQASTEKKDEAVTVKTPGLSVASDKVKVVSVKIETVSGADGYRLYMSEDNGKSFTAIKTISKEDKNSFELKNLQAGHTYYFKSRAYKKVSGKKVWSKYSKTISVTVLSDAMVYRQKEQDKMSEAVTAYINFHWDRLAEMNYVRENRIDILCRLINEEDIRRVGKYSGTVFDYSILLWQYPHREGFEVQIDGVYITQQELINAGTSQEWQDALVNSPGGNIFFRRDEPWVYGIAVKYKDPIRSKSIELWSPESIKKYTLCDDLMREYDKLLEKVNELKAIGGSPSKTTQDCIDYAEAFIAEFFGTREFYELNRIMALSYEEAHLLVLYLSPSLLDYSDFKGEDLVTALDYYREEDALYKELEALSSEIDKIDRNDIESIRKLKKKADELFFKLKVLSVKTMRLSEQSYFGRKSQVFKSEMPGVDMSIYIDHGVEFNNTPVIGFEITNNESRTITISAEDSYLFPQTDIIVDPYDGIKASLISDEGKIIDSVSIAPNESKWLWFYFDGKLVDSYEYRDNERYAYISIISFNVHMGDKDYFYNIDGYDILNFTDYYNKFKANLERGID